MALTTAVQDLRTINRLLTRAEVEARRDGQDAPGPEHLVLAATDLPDGTAARALEAVGVDPQRLRAAIEQVHTTAMGTVGLTAQASLGGAADLLAPAHGPYRSTPQAQQMFQGALALSKTTKPARLQGAHVVAAACDLEHGTLARALTTLGVDRDHLRHAAHAQSQTS